MEKGMSGGGVNGAIRLKRAMGKLVEGTRRTKQHSFKRGFVFTLDVIIASLLALAILTNIAIGFRTGSGGLPETLAVNALARDSLAVMDKQGLLKNTALQSDSIAAGNIRTFMDDALPKEYGANVTVEIYEYTPSGNCPNACRLDGNSPANGFCTCRRLSANTTPAMNSSLISTARRMFYVPAEKADSPNERFGRADATVWTR